MESNPTCSNCPPVSNLEDISLKPKLLRKKLVRRALPDHCQSLRRVFQFAFVLLNVWIGAAFYAWVRAFETGTHHHSMTRPAGVEGGLASVLVQNFWCRYLCPYGALWGLPSLLSPLRIRRSPDAGIDCAQCAKVCPSSLPVDKRITIKSAQRRGCLECVAVCPAEDALHMSLPVLQRSPKGRRLPAWAITMGIAVVFLGIMGHAKAAGHWNGDVPDHLYRQLVPHANEGDHRSLSGDCCIRDDQEYRVIGCTTRVIVPSGLG